MFLNESFLEKTRLEWTLSPSKPAQRKAYGWCRIITANWELSEGTCESHCAISKCLNYLERGLNPCVPLCYDREMFALFWHRREGRLSSLPFHTFYTRSLTAKFVFNFQHVSLSVSLVHSIFHSNFIHYRRSSPVIELWSFNLFGGVWAGVWWCVLSIADPYNELKSSGVLLHFRWIEAFEESFPLGMFKLELPTRVASEELRPSWERPSRRFSYRLWLSCSDMNLLSELLCWIWLWSSMRPCCKPRSPPTRFGRKSSVMLLWIMNFCWLQLLAEKFSWRLKIAGKMLNCCESGETELSPSDEEVLFTKPPLAAVQFCLKSNVNAMVIRVRDKLPWKKNDGKSVGKTLLSMSLFNLGVFTSHKNLDHNWTYRRVPTLYALSLSTRLLIVE